MHVIATAGHVDHGKSTLIERLTGIDPDRLADEKARGMTIDLGFAWTILPSGREIGIVDVPGHERFVHTMLAGVGSVDATLFVVDAGEGWMPQSEEHLAILDLLGAHRGVIALTKIDLVDAETLEHTCAHVAGRLRGTTLEGARIVPVSAITGEGMDELRASLDEMLDAEPIDRGRPRLFVDRSFSVKGAGTVVTGTLTGGALHVDDSVVVLPAGHVARIRGMQSHKAARASVSPTSRVALNLAGLDRTDVVRGDAIVLPSQWRPTRALDITLRAVRALDHEFPGRGAFKAYVGSAEIRARVAVFEDGFARLTLAAPVVATPGDRIVLRDIGRRATVAGGTILDAHPPALRDTARVAQLRARAAAGVDDMPTLVVAERGIVPAADLAVLAGSNAAPRDAMTLRTFVCSNKWFNDAAGRLERVLADFHAREPLAVGMPRAEARIADAKQLTELVDALADRVVSDGPLLRLASHRVTLTPEQDGAILRELTDAGFKPPGFADLERRYGTALVRALIDAGVLVTIADDLLFARAQIDEAKARIAAAVAGEGALTTSRIREMLGTSRKYAIPLLEHLDATGFTRRRGDVRDLAVSHPPHTL